MARGKKKESLTIEERLEAALVPEDEQPYEVPENWCWVKLGAYIDYVTDYVANGSFATLKENVNIYKEENYALMVKTADFANDFTKSLTYTDKHGYDFLSKSVLYGGELILSNIGSIGKVFRVPHFNRPMTLASNSVMIKCFNESDYDWIYHFFLSPVGYEELMSITTGTAVLKFNKTDLKTVSIPIPPLKEQHHIVERIESLFSQLDEARDKAQEALDVIQDIWSAIAYDAFSGKLTAEWRKRNNKAETWKEYNLQDVCSMKITDGTHQTPTYCEKEDGGIPFISAKDVTSKKISWDDIKYIIPDLHEELYARIAPQIDDVLLAKNGTTGVAAIVDTDKVFDIYVTLAVLRPNRELILPRYLLNIVNSPVCKDQFNAHLTGIGVPNLHLRDIKAVTISVPDIEEQKEVVRIIDNFWKAEESVIETARAVIDSIELTKKSILAKAFRGELGTNDTDDENAIELIKRILKEQEC